MKTKTKIICIGNRFRSDDSIGFIIADELSKLELEDVSIIESEGEGLDLLNLWSDAERVIIIDAVKSTSKPGTIHIINPIETEIPKEKYTSTSHFFNLAQAIELAKTMKTQGYFERFPSEIKLIGIEAKNFDMGQSISKELQNSVEKVLQIVQDLVNE